MQGSGPEIMINVFCQRKPDTRKATKKERNMESSNHLIICFYVSGVYFMVGPSLHKTYIPLLQGRSVCVCVCVYVCVRVCVCVGGVKINKNTYVNKIHM